MRVTLSSFDKPTIYNLAYQIIHHQYKYFGDEDLVREDEVKQYLDELFHDRKLDRSLIRDIGEIIIFQWLDPTGYTMIKWKSEISQVIIWNQNNWNAWEKMCN